MVRVRGHDTQWGGRGSTKSASVRSIETIQWQNTAGPVVPMSNQDPDISRNIVPFDLHAPQNLEFPSIQKNSIPADFEAHIREIAKELERKVSKESHSAEGISVSLALQLNVLGSKSNGAGITPSCGPTQFGPLTEVDKATLVFVLGPGDVISEALNPTRRNIRGTMKKHDKSANGEKVKKGLKGIGKRLEISTISKEVVMGDQNEDTKRKLDDMRIQKRQTQWWQRGLSWRMQCTWGRFLRNNLDRRRLVSNPAGINEYIKLELLGAWEPHIVNALRKIVQFEALGLVFLMETKLPLRAKN